MLSKTPHPATGRTGLPDRIPGRRRAYLAAVLFLCLLPSTAFGQSAGDFRSLTSGQWSKSGTWEEFDGTNWVDTRNTPDGRAATGTITIRAGHTVTANSSGSYDQLIVEAGATLSVSKAITIVDGAGTDLTVSGTLDVGNTVQLTGNATASLESGSTTLIGNRKSFSFLDNAQGSFASGAQITSDGTLDLQGNATVSIGNGVSYVNTGDISLISAAQLTFNGSTLVNEGTVTLAGATSLIMASGSVYNHAQDGGAFPAPANTVWNTGSSIIVTGATRNAPTNMGGTFPNLTWDAAGQNQVIDLAGSIGAITGDLIITNTGTRALLWDGTTGSTLSIGGDLRLDGGAFIIADAITASTDIGGDLLTAAGTTFTFADGGGSGSALIHGNLLANGNLDTAGGGLGTLEFVGSTAHSLELNGTFIGDVDLLLSGSGLTTATSDLAIPGNVTETSGGLDLAGNALSIENNLVLNTGLSNVSTLTFTGVDSSTLQLAPSVSTLPHFIVDKPASTLTLQSAVTVSSHAIVRNGTLDTNGQSIIFPDGATLFNQDTVLGNVTLERAYSHNADGWRMLSVPVTGPTYSNLNGTFWTQGAPWATKAGGTTNLQAFQFATQDWAPLSGADAAFGSGTGYIMYMFAQDEQGTAMLPATWSVTGSPGSLTSQGLSQGPTPETSYNFLGNPSSANLDWDATWAASSGISASYATWDPALTDAGGTTGYKYYDASSGIGSAGRYIAPFTAYMVQATAAGAFVQPTSSEAASTQSAERFGKHDGMAPHIRLALEGQDLAEHEMIFSFGSEATDESNLFDVVRLSPLSARFATLWSVADTRRLAFDGRTMESGREIYDLALATTQEGVYSIRTSDLHDIPDHWSAILVDTHTGNKLDLRSGSSMTFQTRPEDLVNGHHPMDGPRATRFRLVIEDPDRALTEDVAEVLPDTEPVLTQNFPNPFTESTTIRYSLPESSRVRLEVYDMLGRRIRILADGFRSAGWHEARFDASGLASGMYGYRLTVDGHTISHAMLVLH